MTKPRLVKKAPPAAAGVLEEPEDESNDADEPESIAEIVPLFGRDISEDIVFLAVDRMEPPQEQGYLGKTDPKATEADIKNRWGGGRFHVTARTERGTIKGHRWISIAGDPKFESASARRKWMASQKADRDMDASDTGAGVGAMPTAIDPMAILQWQSNTVRADMERRDRESREHDERMRREAREHEERIRQANEESRQRDREHTQALLTMVQGSQQKGGGGAELVTMMINGLKLGLSLGGNNEGGGEDDDPYGLKLAMAELARGITRGKRDAEDEDEPDDQDDDDGVRLTGKSAEKMRRFVRAMKEAGIDPEMAMSIALDKTAQNVRAKRPPDKKRTAAENVKKAASKGASTPKKSKRAAN
jgi:hypothetical protein